MRSTEFYVYDQPFLILAPGAVASATLTFDAASSFRCFYTAFSAYNHAANTGWTESNRLIPPITITLTPGDTSNQMMNGAVPLSHFFGSGEMPFVLPAPRDFPARSTLAFQVTNNDSTITYDLYLSLIGTRIFLNQ